MRIKDILYLSFAALRINKSRSVLTMLGIIIGIASVILMLSVGQSAQGYLLSQVSSFGSDLVFISNGRGDEVRGGPPSAAVKQTLTEKDIKKIKNLSWPAAVDGSVNVNDLITYGGQNRNGLIAGVSADDIIVFNMRITRGRFISDDDVASRSEVAVLGANIANQFFGEDEPVGKNIKLGTHSYRIIGVLGVAGTRFFNNVDDQVFVPFTAVLDGYNKNKINFIAIKTGDVRPSEAKELIRIALRESHNLDNPRGDLAKDDFRVATQEDAVKNVDTIGTVLQILLGSIASISLFVAGIGIMNIMYVTVTERTREIGLRKAIGATRMDILRQFLAEAMMLTVVAGLIGIVVGLTFSWLAIQIILQFQSGWQFIIPWNGVGLGFGVSAAIGMIFGFFPARKAAGLHPIEALRYE